MSKYRVSLYILLSVLLSVVFITGCSLDTDSSQNEPEEVQKDNDSQPNESEEKPEETISLEAPPLPETVEQLITAPSGPFAGQPYDDNREAIEEVLSQLPSLDDPEDEELVQAYWGKLMSFFSEDYPDPADLVAKWKMNEFGNPEIDDPRLQFKDNYNAQIILDASGSMAATIDGRTMMELAKEAIREFASSLPEEANVALRVYGHKGSNANEDKKVSCESSELIYDMQPYDPDKLNEALNQFEPTGWTPIARSLDGAKEDLAEYDGENNTNIIYLVSDGVETCDGDPVQAAKELAESNITPLVNVIGFNVDSEGQNELRKVAEAADGFYATVTNQDQLKQELGRAQEIADKWLEWTLEADLYNLDLVYERESSIFDFKDEWADKSFRENQNLDKAIQYLYESEHFSHEMREEMRTFRNERMDLANKGESTTYKDLMELAQEDYKRIEREIEQRYKRE